MSNIKGKTLIVTKHNNSLAATCQDAQSLTPLGWPLARTWTSWAFLFFVPGRRRAAGQITACIKRIMLAIRCLVSSSSGGSMHARDVSIVSQFSWVTEDLTAKPRYLLECQGPT